MTHGPFGGPGAAPIYGRREPPKFAGGWYVTSGDLKSHYYDASDSRWTHTLCKKMVPVEMVRPPVGKQPCMECSKRLSRRDDVV